MKKQRKPNIKPALNIKPAVNIKPAEKQEQGHSKLFLYSALLLLLLLLASLMVPVYYVPLFKNITARYGLSIDIARKLTLLDLALNSFGIETPNMTAAFQKQNIEYEPDVFYTSRFNSDGKSRLINAKETYYYEYERTKKRPAEIAGIYQNGKEVNTPEIDGDLKGIRALPKGDFGDDTFTDFSYKKATATTVNKDEIMGTKRRQVRGSFDRDGEDQPSKKREPLPDFAASIYDQNKKGETQNLSNSRMVKPDVSEQPFTVVKSENVIAKLVGDSSFTDTFATLKNFGGYGGALGYYIKDDLPKDGLFDFFGNSGRDAFTSYFYSHEAVGRKYIESSKHFSEIAFHGDEIQDKILIAKGQEKDKVPTINEADISPISMILAVKRNIKECEEGRKHYEQVSGPLRTDYKNLKTKLKNISLGHPGNMAKKGAPGCCKDALELGLIGVKTEKLRNEWNKLLPKLKNKCKAIEKEERDYAESCKMDYKRDPNKDDCDSIDALTLDKGPYEENWYTCESIIKWKNLNVSKTFQGCGGYQNFPSYSQESAARQDCADKQEALFKEIDNNIILEAKPGFVFN